MILSDKQILRKDGENAMEKIMRMICEKVDALLQKQERVVLAIDGSCTAGKSTLAAKLETLYDCNVFHMDDFFLRPEQRTQERFAEAGGNVDYERFREEVLLPLVGGKSFAYCPYDCSTGSLKGPVAVAPKRINIIEGTYSHHPYFGAVYDLKIFLQVSEEIRRQRIEQRPAFLHKRFFEQWIPMEQQYFESCSIAENSDLVMLPEANW